MRQNIFCIAIIILSMISVKAQQQDTTRRETPTAVNRGNAGDPQNARRGLKDQTENNTDRSNEADRGSESDAEETQLLGEENLDATGAQEEGNTSSDYRNNEVTGNPNNTTIEDGANRDSGDGETDESSGATQTDSTMTGGSTSASGGVTADPAASNVPAIPQATTSQSGSPAVLSGNEGDARDGTNNVQRAEPNMAGSPVRGMRYSTGADTDRQIREGSRRQQSEAVPNDVSRQKRQRAQGRQNGVDSAGVNTANPHTKDQGTLPGNDEQTTDGQTTSADMTTGDQADSMSSSGTEKKKKKWWQRRKKDKD